MSITRYFNGNVYTMNDACPKVESFVVEDDKIVFVGSNKESSNLYSDAVNVDLNNKTVFPGFIDCHVHLDMYGDSLSDMNISGLDRNEIFTLVEKYAANKNNEWLIFVGGWDSDKWSDTALPRAHELDKYAGDNYVVLPKFDGHSIWVNNKVLDLVGFNENTPDPDGGQIMRDKNGQLTGWLVGEARVAVEKLYPPKSKEAREKALLKTQDGFLGFGITSVQDAWTKLEDIEAIEDLYENKALKMRVGVAPYINHDTQLNTLYKDFYPQNDKYGGRYSKKAMKILVDGSMSSYSASFREDYADRPGHRGKLNYTDDELRNIFKFCADRGFQLLAHTIGDGASQQYLDIAEEVVPKKAKELRFRMEHFHVGPDDLLQRAGKLGVCLVPNPTHGPFFYNLGPQRLGERIKIAYSIRRMMKYVEHVSFGSDASVTTPNIFLGTYAAVARKNPEHMPENGYLPEAAVTLDQALHAYTIWAAYTIRQEDNRGSIEKGKYADFVVLSDDVYNIDIDSIVDVKVLETYISGEKVYSK